MPVLKRHCVFVIVCIDTENMIDPLHPFIPTGSLIGVDLFDIRSGGRSFGSLKREESVPWYIDR
jgi:hypothetical protein